MSFLIFGCCRANITFLFCALRFFCCFVTLACLIHQLYHIVRCLGKLPTAHAKVFLQNKLFVGIRLPEAKEIVRIAMLHTPSPTTARPMRGHLVVDNALHPLNLTTAMRGHLVVDNALHPLNHTTAMRGHLVCRVLLDLCAAKLVQRHPCMFRLFF